MRCPSCHSDLLCNHSLENCDIPLMKNKSRILHPACSVCGHVIQLADVSTSINASRKVLLITGTAGARKTALGQLIERESALLIVDYHAETINTMLILSGLGYHVVVGYIINNNETLAMYVNSLKVYGVTPVFRILVPERSVCLARDLARDCWTAGAEWVDQWYDEMRAFLATHPSFCIDTTNETLEETFNRHFANLL